MPSASSPTTSRIAGLALVVAAAVLFGTSGIAKGLGPDGLRAVFTGAWRTFVGGAALVVGAAASRRTLPRRPTPLTIGAVAVVVYQLCFFAALERLGVATTVVVSIGTGPIVAGVLDVFALTPSADDAERRPTPGFVGGAAVAIAGVILVSWPLGDLDPLGALSAVVAGAAVPVYGAAAQALMAPGRADASGAGAGGARPLEAMASIFGAAAVLVAPAVVWSTIDLAGRAAPPPLGSTVATVAWLGLAATGLAYWLWGRGLAGLSLSVVAVATMAEPAAATILSWVVLDDPVRLTTACGVVVVAVGVWLAARD